MQRKTDILAEAQALAECGLGWEDLSAKIGRNRISRLEARAAVFGRELATKMEFRDALRARNERKRVTTKWLKELEAQGS